MNPESWEGFRGTAVTGHVGACVIETGTLSTSSITVCPGRGTINTRRKVSSMQLSYPLSLCAKIYILLFCEATISSC